MIRKMTADDVPAAVPFCRSAGWNQLNTDWSRLIDHEPDGCFVAVDEQTIVGTVTTTRYGTQLAWIGMMLIHPDFRRRGIATELMNASLEYLREWSVSCIKLDATPAGQPVYERLGFQIESSFRRWSRKQAIRSSIETPTGSTVSHRALTPSNLDVDRVAFGVDRADWLNRLASDSTVRVNDGGFAMLRSGHLADYLGPIVATSATSATELVDTLLNESRHEQTYWDVMNSEAEAIAMARGFGPVRELTRMWVGSKLEQPKMEWQYAISDPATG